MIRLALPKGRNLEAALAALRAAGHELRDFDTRKLLQTLPEDDIELLLLKDWDIPVYVEHGIADCGVVGTDVLEELGGDLLVPLRLLQGRCRFSLIGLTDEPPAAGRHIRVATKYPRWSRRLLAGRPWDAEIVELTGSVELGPILDLAEIALDIVQSGQTLRDHDLKEIEVLQEVAPTLVVNPASFHRHRADLNRLMERLEAAEVAS